jgi:hypothetical protein
MLSQTNDCKIQPEYEQPPRKTSTRPENRCGQYDQIGQIGKVDYEKKRVANLNNLDKLTKTPEKTPFFQVGNIAAWHPSAKLDNLTHECTDHGTTKSP